MRTYDTWYREQIPFKGKRRILEGETGLKIRPNFRGIIDNFVAYKRILSTEELTCASD